MSTAYREQHIKREMTQCRHFKGIQHEACSAGIKYRELFGDAPGWAKNLVCLGDKEATVTCASFAALSREEAEKDADDHEARMERFSRAHKAAKDNARERGLKRGNGGAGSLKCPNCEAGEIRYTVAGYNGHMRAACSTKGCVSWME